jgi:hypothetical protein
MSSRITPPSADTGSSGRRWTLTLAGILLLAVIACGLYLLAGNRGDNPGSAPAPSAPATEPTASAPTDQPTTPPASDRCNLPAGNQTVPTTPIHGAQWSLVNRLAVPSAPAFGPQRSDEDGLRRCFAHSPTGAVYAVYNFIVAMSPPGDVSGEKTFAVLRRIMAPGPSRDRYIDWLRAADDPSSGTDTSLQLVGFKVLDATANRATILVASLAASPSGSGYVSSVWTLVWQSGDWRVVAPKPGEMAGDPYTTVPDLTGFVPWRGS